MGTKLNRFVTCNSPPLPRRSKIEGLLAFSRLCLQDFSHGSRAKGLFCKKEKIVPRAQNREVLNFKSNLCDFAKIKTNPHGRKLIELKFHKEIWQEMARKTKARALLDRQKAEESLQASMNAKKGGDGKNKALKIKGLVYKLFSIF